MLPVRSFVVSYIKSQVLVWLIVHVLYFSIAYETPQIAQAFFNQMVKFKSTLKIENLYDNYAAPDPLAKVTLHMSISSGQGFIHDRVIRGILLYSLHQITWCIGLYITIAGFLHGCSLAEP